MKKTIDYVSDLDYYRRLIVEGEPEDDKLSFMVFDGSELLASGTATRDEINQMLDHWGAKGRV